MNPADREFMCENGSDAYRSASEKSMDQRTSKAKNSEVHVSNLIVSSDQVDISTRKQVSHESNYQPVSWLPAMVVSSEPQSSSYVLDQTPDNRASSDLMSHGAFVQLPASYNINNKQSLYGLVLDGNTVVPLENLSLVNFQSGFGKLENHEALGNDDQGMGENIQGLVKGEGEVSNEGVGDPYVRMSGESSLAKEHLYCVYCQKLCKDMNELQAHIMIDHSDQPPLGSYVTDTNNIHPALRTCPACGHQLRRVGEYDSDYPLTAHDEEHNIQIAASSGIHMMCDNCCKEFTLGVGPETQASSSHIQETPKRHYCEHCDKSYKHNRDLRKHLRTHHGYDTSSHVSLGISGGYSASQASHTTYHQDPPPQNTKMVCQQCKKMFRGPFELRRHIHTVHENKRPYKCPECSKLFRDAYELKRHSASHQRMHYHDVSSSGVNVNSQSLDLMHISNMGENQGDRTHNTSHLSTGALIGGVYPGQHQPGYASTHGSLDYYCSACEKNFRGANEFKRHYSVVHEKKYRYKCIHCGKLWRDQYDLKRHCRRSHFVDRDIDRNFIRQCLLDNNNTTAVDTSIPSQTPITLSNYDMGRQMTLTLNHEAAAAIFGNSEQDIRNSTTIDPHFNMVDHESITMTRSPLRSPSAAMFQNMTTIPPASMLYQSEDASRMVENMIQNQDAESAMREESKNAVNWSNFEADIQPDK